MIMYNNQMDSTGTALKSNLVHELVELVCLGHDIHRPWYFK